MSSLDLPTIWFILVGVLFTGYAILEGFDLGVGALHLLLAKTDGERRLFLNTIGPVWDGNEVWLVTGGGALFAAFPMVYATVFSGFYLAFILLLFSLIFRAVSIEFRSRRPQAWWRRLWDAAFSIGSILSAFLIGVAAGNIAWGVPLDARHEFAGTFAGLLRPYPLLLGLTAVALFAAHGAIYLALKLPDGALRERVTRAINPALIAFILPCVLLSLATLLYVPHITDSIKHEPWFFAVVTLAVLAVANIPRCVSRGEH
ncbi:MAG: cytochrome d ubiquinol oxidase subunit II, partial [Opitutaceae bacterium]|nr:cytochrome d ubiquinol oxidase subunit II [Opitutaceae bacterium]